MKHLVKISGGAAYELSLEEIREALNKGEISNKWTIKPQGEKEYRELIKFLEEEDAGVTRIGVSNDASDSPSIVNHEKLILFELREIKSETKKVKWACRSIAIGIWLFIIGALIAKAQ